MGLSKDKLIYDSTTPSDGDSVAAFLRTSAGALTSTGAAGALDVNITNAISVDADGVYSGGNTNPDNIGIIGHVRGASPADTDQTLRLTGGNPSADNIDPANVFALDTSAFMYGWDGTAWDRVGMSNGSLNVAPLGNVADDAVDSGNPVKIGSRAVSGALTAVSASGDRADLLSDLYRRIWVNTAPNVGGSNAAISITDAAGGTSVFASPLAGRRRVLVQNLDNKAIYLGFGTVSQSNGIRVAGGASWSDEMGPNIDLKAISEAGETADVRGFQLA